LTQNTLISVVIPTFNRAKLLRTCLRSLENQTLDRNQYEVIVIDDGSQDSTKEVCLDFQSKILLKYIYQKNSGIAAAKNLGVFASKSPIVLFFDDDDIAEKNLLKEHLKTHSKNPQENVAVLGYTNWLPSLKVSPLMDYIINVGQFLFSYNNLKNGQSLDFTYFWGGRTSCKKLLLIKHGVFNHQFRFGSEDIELGYRLSKFGLNVIYNPNAISYMVRPITYKQFCERCEKQGKSQYIFSQLHPDPHIQRYCQVTNAEEKWQYVKESLHRKVDRVNYLESLLLETKSNEEKRLINLELMNLYAWTFNGFKIKGIVQEKTSDLNLNKNNRGRSSAPEKISNRDIEYFKGKWINIPDLPHARGNILVIDPFLPMFDKASGSLRLFHILKLLKWLNYHVTFIARDDLLKDMYMPILQNLGIEVYSGDPSALEAIGMLKIGSPLNLKHILKSRFYELAILSMWDIAEYYLPFVKKYSPGTKIWIDTVDIHFVREIREAKLKRDNLKKKQAEQNKRREINIYNKADALITVTEKDKQTISQYIKQKPIHVLPNIHETIHWQKEFTETKDLLFIGNFNHPPNIDAVKFFVEKVWPLIESKLPNIKLYIVGTNPPQEIIDLGNDNVKITGYVKDLSTYLKRARISVNPLRFGAGMKGKIGEALSWGLPVVTTEIGAEGMHLKHGKHVLIADEAEAFAESVITLYQDQVLWEKLSLNGRKLVEENWSPQVLGNRVAEILSHAMRDAAVQPEVSIVMLTWNAHKYTRKCIESIMAHTRLPFELVIVDNNSTDGTRSYLKNLQRKYENVHVIFNKENRGFGAGNNQGAELAKGQYLLFLNNDVLVYENWLETLVASIEKDDRIGMVGPITNYISGRQIVKDVPYEKDDFISFAKAIHERNKGKLTPRRRLAGFALLTRREDFFRVGGFDESLGIGNFEDDDLCLRYRQEGLVLMCDESVFIHHYGSQTFKANHIDYKQSLRERGEKFRKKWPHVDYNELLELKNPLDKYLPFLINQADELFAKKEYEQALNFYRIVVKENPLDLMARVGEMKCLNKMGRISDALVVSRTLLEKDPEHSEGLYQTGLIIQSLGKINSAKAIFEKVVKLDPGNRKALKALLETHNLVSQKSPEMLEPEFSGNIG